MEDFYSLWNYEEGFDELKQKLLYTTIELEALKVEASEEIRKHKEDVKYLIGLLKMAYKERDEAKNLTQKLLDKLKPSINNELHPEASLLVPVKEKSSITESDSLSDAYNLKSSCSSPVDSFFDPISSPDLSSRKMTDSNSVNFDPSLVIDPVDAAIDKIVTGKALPEKGKLLRAVTEAGPLLQTLLLAGPLPQWRNPPPLQTVMIPATSVNGLQDRNIMTRKPARSSSQKLMSLANYPDMYRGSSQLCSVSLLNFTNGSSGSCVGSGKRQRFH